MKKVLSILGLVLLISSCQTKKEEPALSETAQWELGWRMIASSWDEDYQLGEKQFDSLLAGSNALEPRFVLTGLEILDKLGKKEKFISVVKSQDQEILQEICSRDLFAQKLKEVEVCASVRKERVSHPELQMELIRMYVLDQGARGNIMEDILAKYKLEYTGLDGANAIAVDKSNRERLKEIFKSVGFPSREMVGKDAMTGIFLMI